MTAISLRAGLVLMVCCAVSAAAMARGTLYERLGGATGVAAISTTLIDRVAADPLTGPNFKGSKLERIKRLLAEQICVLADGPCHYSGDPMKDVHAGHHISEAMFYVMVDKLRAILHERHVDLRSRNELLGLLAPMKQDVVEHRRGRGGTTTPTPTPAPAPAPAAAR